MLTSSAAPYDFALLLLLAALAVVLLIGAVSASVWSPAAATVVRRGAVGVAVGATAVVYLCSPTRDPFVGLGRIFTIWCPLAVAALLYGIWSWRAGRW